MIQFTKKLSAGISDINDISESEKEFQKEIENLNVAISTVDTNSKNRDEVLANSINDIKVDVYTQDLKIDALKNNSVFTNATLVSPTIENPQFSTTLESLTVNGARIDDATLTDVILTNGNLVDVNIEGETATFNSLTTNKLTISESMKLNATGNFTGNFNGSSVGNFSGNFNGKANITDATINRLTLKQPLETVINNSNISNSKINGATITNSEFNGNVTAHTVVLDELITTKPLEGVELNGTALTNVFIQSSVLENVRIKSANINVNFDDKVANNVSLTNSSITESTFSLGTITNSSIVNSPKITADTLVVNSLTFSGPIAQKNISDSSISGSSIVNSTIVNCSITSENIVGSLKGNFSGNSTGNFTGNVLGNIGGNLDGNFTGNAIGNFSGNSSGNFTGNAIGNFNGNFIGNSTGNFSGELIGNAIGNFNGNFVGNAVGEFAGNVFGNVVGNSSGNFTGDVEGNFTGNAIGNFDGIFNGSATFETIKLNVSAVPLQKNVGIGFDENGNLIPIKLDTTIVQMPEGADYISTDMAGFPTSKKAAASLNDSGHLVMAETVKEAIDRVELNTDIGAETEKIEFGSIIAAPAITNIQPLSALGNNTIEEIKFVDSLSTNAGLFEGAKTKLESGILSIEPANKTTIGSAFYGKSNKYVIRTLPTSAWPPAYEFKSNAIFDLDVGANKTINNFYGNNSSENNKWFFNIVNKGTEAIDVINSFHTIEANEFLENVTLGNVTDSFPNYTVENMEFKFSNSDKTFINSFDAINVNFNNLQGKLTIDNAFNLGQPDQKVAWRYVNFTNIKSLELANVNTAKMIVTFDNCFIDGTFTSDTIPAYSTFVNELANLNIPVNIIGHRGYAYSGDITPYFRNVTLNATNYFNVSTTNYSPELYVADLTGLSSSFELNLSHSDNSTFKFTNFNNRYLENGFIKCFDADNVNLIFENIPYLNDTTNSVPFINMPYMVNGSLTFKNVGNVSCRAKWGKNESLNKMELNNFNGQLIFDNVSFAEIPLPNFNGSLVVRNCSPTSLGIKHWPLFNQYLPLDKEDQRIWYYAGTAFNQPYDENHFNFSKQGDVIANLPAFNQPLSDVNLNNMLAFNSNIYFNRNANDPYNYNWNIRNCPNLTLDKILKADSFTVEIYDCPKINISEVMNYNYPNLIVGNIVLDGVNYIDGELTYNGQEVNTDQLKGELKVVNGYVQLNGVNRDEGDVFGEILNSTVGVNFDGVAKPVVKINNVVDCNTVVEDVIYPDGTGDIYVSLGWWDSKNNLGDVTIKNVKANSFTFAATNYVNNITIENINLTSTSIIQLNSKDAVVRNSNANLYYCPTNSLEIDNTYSGIYININTNYAKISNSPELIHNLQLIQANEYLELDNNVFYGDHALAHSVFPRNIKGAIYKEPLTLAVTIDNNYQYGGLSFDGADFRNVPSVEITLKNIHTNKAVMTFTDTKFAPNMTFIMGEGCGPKFVNEFKRVANRYIPSNINWRIVE